MTGKVNRSVDTADQFYPHVIVHEFWAAVSEEMVRNSVPNLRIEQAFRHVWHGDEGEAAADATKHGHENTTSEVSPDLSCIPAASEAAGTSPMAKHDFDARAPQAGGGDRSNHPHLLALNIG